MAITTTEILAGINAAEFDAQAWAAAMQVLKLQVSLGLVRAQMENTQAWRDERQAEYIAKLGDLQAQEQAIIEQINALAPEA